MAGSAHMGSSARGSPLPSGGTAEVTPVDPLDVLESALRDAFSSLMTLVDEEDAVLLYRCSRLAEASPLLLESCDQRRTAIEEGLADKCERSSASSHEYGVPYSLGYNMSYSFDREVSSTGSYVSEVHSTDI